MSVKGGVRAPCRCRALRAAGACRRRADRQLHFERSAATARILVR